MMSHFFFQTRHIKHRKQFLSFKEYVSKGISLPGLQRGSYYRPDITSKCIKC